MIMTAEPSKQAVPAAFAREQQLITLLMAFLGSGLFFLLLPGTFLGVWNLFAISNAQSATSVPAAWIQALLASSIILFIGAITVVLALRIFESPEKPAKAQGVHKSFPVFIRIAYAWLLVASLLAVWAATEPDSAGIGGAGRHAMTVGFLMTMVFTVAPRMLPAFFSRKKLFSEYLMFLALVLANTGCFIRVSSEILAYQQIAPWAWILLPISASFELVGVIIFVINMIGTLCQPPLLARAN